jgi:membrane-bound lytic murein transglycosylase B
LVVVAIAPASASHAPAPSAAPREVWAAIELDLASLAPVAAGVAGVPHLARDLAEVEVESVDLEQAAQDYATAAGALTGAQRQRRDADFALGELTVELNRTSAALAIAQARQQAYRQQHRTVLRALQEMLVSLYVDGGYQVDDAAFLDPDNANAPQRQRVITEAAFEDLEAEEERLADLLEDATRARERAQDERDAVLGRHRAALADRTAASGAQLETAEPVASARAVLESERATAMVSDGDFALVALDTYRRAAVAVTEIYPDCRLEWWGLAGIARVEGRHGTYGGARLDAFGDTDPQIIGIALNGDRNTRVITDTDDGALDHDPIYDHAVGPMQFIPSTWRRWAADGDGDALEDPHNLYDATLAAAGYLCRASLDLVSDDGLRRAYFSYNHSLAYVDNVLRWARLYEQVEVPKVQPPEPT